MVLNSTQLFEDEVRKVVCEMCAEMRPSRKTVDAIMHYAATYEMPN